MATVGRLSRDQARYRAGVVAGTGLHPRVVTAWIGAESGWGTSKPGHNYLNVGPGRRYRSVDQAAAAVVTMIRNGDGGVDHYAGIRAAVGKGPGAQIAAIAASPWDAGHYGGDGSRLRDVYAQLAGKPLAATAVSRDQIDIPGPWNLDRSDLPANPLGGLRDDLVVAGVTVAFTLAALVLIVLGVVRVAGPAAGKLVSGG